MKKVIGLLAVLSLTLGASIQAKAADLNPWTDCGIGAPKVRLNTTNNPIIFFILNLPKVKQAL